jgi:hypothetical protein
METNDEREAKRRKLIGRAMVIGLGALVLLYLAATFIR